MKSENLLSWFFQSFFNTKKKIARASNESCLSGYSKPLSCAENVYHELTERENELVHDRVDI